MLSEKELDHLSRLARIRLPHGEAERMLNDLENILGYVASLSELDTSEVEGAATESQGAFRADLPCQTTTHDEALRNAPAVLDGHFAVPTVMARDEALNEASERAE